MAEDLTEDQVRDKARGILDFVDRPGSSLASDSS